jgi:exodeoxyribonuclease-5
MSRVLERLKPSIDECSMVDAKLGADVLSFGVPVLVLGDPAQLPPIHGTGFFTDAPPDIMLTDVQRQAHDNPIICMATTVREGGRLEVGKYGSSRVVPRNTVMLDEHAAADQILVGRNILRRQFNHCLRDHLGFRGAIPQPGDRLICLRNNHTHGLLNGSMWITRAAVVGDRDSILLTIASDDAPDFVIHTKTHLAFFRGTELSHSKQREFDAFDFGYAITVHEAQGSQWANAIVLDESKVFEQDAKRWLYTAITRASNSVTVAL